MSCSATSSLKRFQFAAALLTCGLAWFEAAGAAEPAPQKLAIVNVSFIFENYKKVSDLQRNIDEKFKLDEGRLQLEFKELAQRNKELDEFMNKANLESVDPVIFEKVQLLRRDQFNFNRKRQQYDEDVQRAYSKGMKDILTDIRVAIRTVAGEGKFDVVLRSPDAEDPDSGPKNQPTYLQSIEPKTVAEMTERFNRNPVLFGSKTTDITTDVLARLSNEYNKRSSGGNAQK